MKKRGIIGLALAVCLLLAPASPVSAAAPTITTVTPNSGVQGNTYTSVTIVGTDFTGATAVSFGAGITVNGYIVDLATQITASITIATGATAGTRDVAVTTPEGIATKTSGFTVELATITVTAPTGFSLGYMTAGATITGTVTAGSVATNAQNWQVTAKELTNTSLNVGKMTIGANGTNPLTAKFQISKTTGSSGLVDSDGGLTYNQATDAGKTLPFFVSQVVASGAVAGAYQITITFTGSTQ